MTGMVIARWIKAIVSKKRTVQSRRKPLQRLVIEGLEKRDLLSASPFVQSINLGTPANSTTNASSVSYTVTFNKSVTGVDSTDFAVTTTGSVASIQIQVTPVTTSVYTVKVNGISGIGTLGLNLVDNGSIHDLLSNPLTTTNATASFASQVTIGSGSNPKSVTTGDLNGDGNPDLVVVNSSNTVSVLLGNGNSTFQAQQSFATGLSPCSVVVGDVNGDGKPDLVITNFGSNSESVLLGNGNGSFQTQQTFATGSKPSSVALADVNGDGKIDLLVANFGNGSTSVLLGNNNGTFQKQQTFATSTKPESITVGDVNGDGKSDLVVANYGSNTVGVLLGNGDGTFQSQQTFTTSTSPFAATLSDVNSDGKLDILVANNTLHGSVSVLLGNGNGTFQSQQSFAVGKYPRAVSASDVNGDGRPDLIVANTTSNAVSVLLGNGNGTFQKQLTFATGFHSNSIAVGDVNKDGKPDLIVGNANNSTVSLLLGNGNGNFAGQIYTIFSLPTVTTPTQTNITGTTATLGGNVTNDGGQPIIERGVLYAVTSTNSNPTINSTSVTKAVASGASTGVFSTSIIGLAPGTTYSFVAYATNSGGTKYSPISTIQTLPNISSHSPVVTANTSSMGSQTSSIVIHGFFFDPRMANNSVAFNDGAAGYVSAANTTSLTVTFTSNPINNGNLTAIVLCNNATSGAAVQVASIDTIAPFVQSIQLANPVSATTSLTTVSYTVTFSEAVTGVDETDFAATTSGSVVSTTTSVTPVSSSVYTVSISGITGHGTLGLNLVDNGSILDQAGNQLTTINDPVSFATQQTFVSGANPTSVTLGDVNGDGNSDLVVADSGNTVSVLLGNGNGTFQTQQTLLTGAGPSSVKLGDVNGDGNLDLVVTNFSSGSVSVLLGNGDGTFLTQHTFASEMAPSAGTIGDVDGDGVADLVVTNFTSGTVSVLLGNGDGSFQAQRTFAIGIKPESIALNDVNGDGIPDLVVANYGSNSAGVLLGNGNGSFQTQQTFATGTSPFSLTVGDVNGDDKPDLLVANDTLHGSVSVLLGNGNGTFQAQHTFTSGAYPRSIALTDVNGDGSPDLVVANTTGNSVSVLLGNGNGTFQTPQTLANNYHASSVSVGDVNGDGKPDVVVANSNHHTASVFLGNSGGNFTGQLYTIQAIPVVTVSDASGPYNATTYDATGSATYNSIAVAGSFTYTYYVGAAASGSGSTSAPVYAGTYTVVTHFAPTDSTSFTIADSLPLTFTISPRPITVTAVTTTKSYDGTASTSNIPTITGGSLAGADTAVFTETFDSVNAGVSKTLSSSGAVADANNGQNYAVTFIDVLGRINKVHLLVAADDQSMFYTGTPFSIFTAKFTGFISGENTSNVVITGTPTFSGTAPTAVNVGTYNIHIADSSQLSAVNYDFTVSTTDGTLEIKATANELYVVQAYQQLTGSSIPDDALATYTNQLNQGSTHLQVVNKIVQTHAFSVHIVPALYQSYLSSVANQTNIAYAESLLDNGATVQSLIAQMISSASYWQVRAGSSSQGFLNAVATDLDIHPTASTIASISSQLPISSVRLAFVTSSFASTPTATVLTNYFFQLEQFNTNSFDQTTALNQIILGVSIQQVIAQIYVNQNP